MIALIAAVPLESELLRQWLSPCAVRSCGGFDLYSGRLGGQSVCLLHTGVGKSNAAAAMALFCAEYRPQAAISFGCAGAYPGSDLALGDLVLASEEMYGDEGSLTPGGFLDMQDLGFPLVHSGGHAYYNRFPADATLLAKAQRACSTAAASLNQRLAVGTAVTVSTCSGSNAAGRELAQRSEGLCETMEGAAVAHICTLRSIPFVEIRGISNFTEDRDPRRWDLRAATRSAQTAVMTLLESWKERNKRA